MLMRVNASSDQMGLSHADMYYCLEIAQCVDVVLAIATC